MTSPRVMQLQADLAEVKARIKLFETRMDQMEIDSLGGRMRYEDLSERLKVILANKDGIVNELLRLGETVSREDLE